MSRACLSCGREIRWLMLDVSKDGTKATMTTTHEDDAEDAVPCKAYVLGAGGIKALIEVFNEDPELELTVTPHTPVN